MDRLGIKKGFALALDHLVARGDGARRRRRASGRAAASCSACFGLAYSSSVAGFMFVRFLLGLGESGNFPAAIKTVAEWFPRSERAFATGIFNAGTNIGAVITPMAVPCDHRRRSAGTGRSSSPACSGSGGWCSGGRSTTGPTGIRASAPPSWR